MLQSNPFSFDLVVDVVADVAETDVVVLVVVENDVVVAAIVLAVVVAVVEVL